MTEAELRALVRSIVAERMRPSPGALPVAPRLERPSPPSTAGLTVHVSHGRFVLAPDPDGHCFIEPGTPCNHCGFCQSYGH